MTTPEEMDESLWRFWSAKALKQADLIQELEARNKELTLQLLAVHGQAADALDRAVVAEAKLAKAVEALVQLERIVGDILGAHLQDSESRDKAIDLIKTTLAELEAKE